MSDVKLDAKTVFSEAIEISSPANRAAYIEEACGEDNRLREEVQDLLKAHFAAGSFLDPPGEDLDATADSSPIAERSGTVIGRYKLLQNIGEGGFGVVFMAEQREPVHRKVALKIIKPGMDPRKSLRGSKPNSRPWL